MHGVEPWQPPKQRYVGHYPGAAWGRNLEPPTNHHNNQQRTTSKSHIGELAPMALCDIHVAGCGEHLPAWGLRDDILGTDQAVRGGRHGQKLHSRFPPRQGDARGSADARSSTDTCLS